ncbi:hypothetical protein [Mycobacteroides abscessus]|uniref:hypothetical protein n=1 Tax=Mycobacteroides abscessus TaxID=36809 RepID=UPI0013F60D24|nr:hypothetical protein [Mycobacteroides abscessus]
MKLSATVGRRRQDHHGGQRRGRRHRLIAAAPRARAAIARELRFSFRHLFDSHH